MKSGRYLILAALATLYGCAEVKLSKPSLDRLSQGSQQLYIDAIEISFREEPETQTLVPKLKNALATVRPTDSPVGRAATLGIHITNFHDMSGAQSLLIGGTNQISYSVRIKDSKSKDRLYQIDLQDQSGYAPGGIIGVITEASSDDELEMSQKLAERVEATVLRANNIVVARGAIVKVIKTQTARKEPTRVGAGREKKTALKSTQDTSAAYTLVPNGPLESDEIRRLVSEQSLYDPEDEGGFFVEFEKNGILQGQNTQNQGDLHDSGRWSIDGRDRLCMKWSDKDGGTRTCYRVSKRNKSLLLRGRGRTIEYQFIN